MAINPSFRMYPQHFPNNLFNIKKSICFSFEIQETRFEFFIADRDTIEWSWLVTLFKVF